MIATADPTTYQLAALIGAICIATAIGAWRDPSGWERMFDELQASPTLMLVAAFTAVLFGALVLLLPGGWSDPLAIAVSGVGLLSLGEGLVLLAIPAVYLDLVRPLLRHARLWAAFAMLLGVIFFVAGVSGMIN